MSSNLLSRRHFVINSLRTGIGLALAPSLLGRGILAYAQTTGASAATSTSRPKSKTFVMIVLRGALDGLSLLPPIEDPLYLSLRPNIALKPNLGADSPLKIGEAFGLHPAASALKPLWQDKTLAFIHQVGSPENSRSHFDAQDFLETGTPGKKTTSDGFLNRALQGLEAPFKSAALRGVAMQPSMPRVLQGRFSSLSMGSLREFNLKSGEGFESMYSQAADRMFKGAGLEAFESLRSVSDISLPKDNDDGGYPKTQIAKRLRDVAYLIKADLGVQIAVTDLGGWDTHIYQGNAHGQLSDRIKELSEALSAFVHDLGPRYSDVCVACATEFGRTVKENGTRGTDHGHGSVLTVLGGAVKGGKIYGEVRSLAQQNLFEGRDLQVTTDYRDIFSEILSKHLGLTTLANVFPGYSNLRGKWVGIL